MGVAGPRFACCPGAEGADRVHACHPALLTPTAPASVETTGLNTRCTQAGRTCWDVLRVFL